MIMVKREELVGNYGKSVFDLKKMICICREFNTDTYSVSIWKLEYMDVYSILVTHFKKGYFEVNTYNDKVSIQQRWDTGERQDIKKCPVWLKKIIENNIF